MFALELDHLFHGKVTEANRARDLQARRDLYDVARIQLINSIRHLGVSKANSAAAETAGWITWMALSSAVHIHAACL